MSKKNPDGSVWLDEEEMVELVKLAIDMIMTETFVKYTINYLRELGFDRFTIQ